MKTLLYTCLQYDEVFICGNLGTPGHKDHHLTDSFSIVFLSPDGRTPNPRVPKSQKMQTSSRWRHMYNKEKLIDNKCFIGCHNVKKYFVLLLHFVHAALAQGAPAMVTIRGGPFDTQGGGGFVKFRKQLSGFHLLKNKLSGSHVVRKKISGPRRAANFVA